jgi:hypothetical protein
LVVYSQEDKPPLCSVNQPQECVETFRSPSLDAGDYVLEVYEWTNTNSLDTPNPAHQPIGRTCFAVTVTR